MDLDVEELLHGLFVLLHVEEALAGLEAGPHGQDVNGDLRVEERGVVLDGLTGLVRVFKGPSQPELRVAHPLALRKAFDEVLVGLACAGVILVCGLHFGKAHHHGLGDDGLETAHFHALGKVPTGGHGLLQLVAGFPGLEAHGGLELGLGVVAEKLLKHPGGFFILSLAVMGTGQLVAQVFAERVVLDGRQGLGEAFDNHVLGATPEVEFGKFALHLYHEGAFLVFAEEALVEFDGFGLPLLLTFAPCPFVERLVGELGIRPGVGHLAQVGGGGLPLLLAGERESSVVGDPLEFLVLRVALQNLGEQDGGLGELFKMDIGEALLEGGIRGQRMLRVLGDHTKVQRGGLMFFLGGIDPAEKVVHPQPLGRGPALEWLLVQLGLTEEALKGCASQFEVTTLVGKASLLGECEGKVWSGLGIEAGEGFEVLKGLDGILGAVVGDRELDERGVHIGIGRDLLLVLVFLLHPGGHEGFQRLKAFLPLLLAEMAVAHQKGQLGKEWAFRLLGQKRVGSGQRLIPLALVVVDLGHPEGCREGIGVVLVCGLELLVGLDRGIELIEQEHVLSPQETGVTGHPMVLELGKVVVGESQARVVVLELVVAGGPLGEHFCELAEHPAIDLS